MHAMKVKRMNRRMDILNFNLNELGSRLVRGRTLVLIFIVERALEGKKARKSRAVLEWREKGLKVVETSVMKRVIIFYKSLTDPMDQ